MAKEYKLDEKGVAALNRIIRKVDQMRGDGVKNSPESIVITQQAVPRSAPADLQIGLTFRVGLTQTGGSAGDKTTSVSFTYTVTDLRGNQLGTAKAPEWPSRSEHGLKVAATGGLAYYDTSHNIQLAIAFERAGTGSC